MTSTPPIQQPPKVPRPTPVPRRSSPLIEALLERNSGEAGKLAAALDALASAGLPVIEPLTGTTSVVTFLYRAAEPLDSVLLFANRLTDETQLDQTLLEPIAGTDYWYAAFEMEKDWRASYCFLPTEAGAIPSWQDAEGHTRLRAALDAGIADPHNPLTCPNRSGNLLSVVELAEAPHCAYAVEQPGAETPQWDQLQAEGEPLTYSLLPIGNPSADAPLVLAFDGEVWAAQGLPAALRRAVADGALTDLHLLLLHSGDRRQRWNQLGADSPLTALLARELLPHLAAVHGLNPAPERTLLTGQSLGAMASLIGVLTYPEVFGGALAQSASLWNPVAQELLETLASRGISPAHQRLQLHLECGSQEWVLLEPNQKFTASARELGLAASLGIFNGGHDYACWRVSLPQRLIEIFPGQPAER